MKPRLLHLLVAAAVSLLSCAANTASAGTTKYPAKAPVFVFDVPEGWKTKLVGGAADALYCRADDDSGLNAQFFTIENSELGDDYPAFAKAALAAGKATGIEVANSGDETVGDDLTVKFVRSTFKQSGDASFVSLMVFLPLGSGKTCAIHCFLPADQLDDHKADIQKLLGSIKMLR